MARLPRFAPAGLPLHVTQRGNFRQDVFLTEYDRRFYLALLDRHSAERRVKIIAYCLMTNHIHLIVEPSTDDGLSIMMQGLQCEFARTINSRCERTGHLWKTRFDACVMDEFHLGIALAYVEMNPVRAKITTAAASYEWSSAKAHTGQAPAHALLHMPSFTNRFAKKDWTAILANKEEDREELASIRKATRDNVPFAAPDFIHNLESAHGCRLERKPPGRPAKLLRQAS